MKKELNGVIAIVTSPDWHVQGSAVDFSQVGSSKTPRAYDGSTINGLQEQRALDKVWRSVLKEHCSSLVCMAVTSDLFTLREIAGRLREQGWKETIHQISIDEEETS